MTSVIHVVRSDGFAGVERYITETAAELAARGWQVTVLGGRPGDMRRELPAGVAFRPARHTIDVLRALRSLPRHDIVHAHMTAAEVSACALKHRIARRLVVTRHFTGRRGRTAAARLVAPLVAARIDRQIAISDFVAASLGEPSTVVHNGVRASSEPPVARERTVVLMHRLEAEKHTDVALDAWRLSGLDSQGWRMLVFGTGSEEAGLRRRHADLLDAGTVTFAGFTPTPRAELGRCGILLAVAPGEPFGLTVVEAMAEGAPVVAARGGAHPETLGPRGCFFEPDDVVACAEALRDLAGSQTRRESVAREQRDRHARYFTVGHHVDLLTEIYHRVIAADVGR